MRRAMDGGKGFVPRDLPIAQGRIARQGKSKKVNFSSITTAGSLIF
jgi:hypothetical protein